MTSQTQSIIQNLIQPFTKSLSTFSLENLSLLIQETKNSMTIKQFNTHIDQWKILAKKLNTNDKLTYLKQQNCRLLIIELIKQEAMHLFNSSYLNRAKIDNEYIRYLKQLGPYFFIEVIMIVSKLKTIHKHFYHKINKSMCQNHITLKILRILELCNQKKRSINNNKAKFLCIVEDETDRLEITKELGKMLRQSWKRQKSKEFQQEQPQLQQEPLQIWEQKRSVQQTVKEMVKQSNQLFQDEYNFDLSDQLLNFDSYPQHTYRYSDNSSIFLE